MPEREGEGDPEFPGAPIIPKADRPPPPPPGGGPGGGPGFDVSFGGRRPALFRSLTSLGENLPVLLRKRGLNMGAGVLPQQPGRSDTVPAMLTPGEMVMNTGVTQDPQNLEALMSMNQRGALRMNQGGMVPDTGGGMPESNALRILRLLLELDGPAQGFAFGGIAGGPFGVAQNWGRRPGMGGAFGKPQAQPGVNVPGGAPRPGGGPVAAPPPQGGFDYQRDTEGQVTNFDPANPWGAYGANQNPYGLGALYRTVGAGGAAGAFDPRGNQALIQQQIEAAQGTKDALVRRSMNSANLYGLDPAQAAAAKMQAQREAGRGVQDISANVRAQGAQRQDEFMKQLLAMLAQGGQQYNLQEQAGRNQRMAINQQGRQGGGTLGGTLGTLGGAAIGGFLGGPAGASAGAGIGRTAFGRP